MNDYILTTDELANILGVHSCTIRTYLSNSMFANFRSRLKHNNHVKDVYIFNNKFIRALSMYLIIRRNEDALKNLKKYCYEKEIKNDTN